MFGKWPTRSVSFACAPVAATMASSAMAMRPRPAPGRRPGAGPHADCVVMVATSYAFDRKIAAVVDGIVTQALHGRFEAGPDGRPPCSPDTAGAGN